VARTQEKTQSKKQPAGQKPKPSSTSRKSSAKRGSQRSSKSAKSRNAVIRYFQETRDELRKVTWPTQEQTIRLTLIVLGTSVAFALVLGFLDRVFLELETVLLRASP
jgi:preprotein translocase subunit SecE